MTNNEYVEHLGKVLKAYTSMFAAALEAELARLVEENEINPERAVEIFTNVRNSLVELLTLVENQMDKTKIIDPNAHMRWADDGGQHHTQGPDSPGLIDAAIEAK